MASTRTTQALMMTLVYVAWRAGFAYTKCLGLGHPVVHVLARVRVCHLGGVLQKCWQISG